MLIRLLSNGSGSDEQGDEPGDELLLMTDSEDELLSDGKDKLMLLSDGEDKLVLLSEGENESDGENESA